MTWSAPKTTPYFSACLLASRCVSCGHWTFQRTGRPNAREGARFLLLTLAAMVCNDLIVWVMSNILLPVHLTPTLRTNSSKVAAIGGTILVSYLGMRLWVFVQSSHEKRERFVHPRTEGSRHCFPAKSGGKNVVTP